MSHPAPSDRPLLMIPGPVEVSPAVVEAASGPPPSHLAPQLIEAFGRALERMREVWRAGVEDQPFLLAGGGTAAMEMAVVNLIEPGERALVVNTGYFSDRMAEMLRRAGAEVVEVRSPVGEAPSSEEVAEALAAGETKALFATHVDTSTGVLVDPQPLARLAREHGALSVFDGVCATAGERFEMAAWGADVYLTASQKALGLPPGLALLVASARALDARAARRAPAPPMYLDWHSWLPILRAYEQRRPSYFSTPATTLVRALAVGLEEILAEGVEARVAAHRRAAGALRRAWQVLDLTPVPAREAITAHTLSALHYPDGLDASFLGRAAARGVVVAGGLHADIRERYFRVGHMGYTVTRPDLLRRAVAAIAGALADSGRPDRAAQALAALGEGLYDAD